MSIERRNFPQFFITAPAPCPYLPGRLERKVFTHLVGQDARSLNTQLSRGGFRRSQNIAYRPACEGCGACVSVRVPVQQFSLSKSFQRVIERNRDLQSTPVRAKAAEDVLIGQTYSEDLLKASARNVQSVLDPESDVHVTADYRRSVAEVLTVRALDDAFRRAKAVQ